MPTKASPSQRELAADAADEICNALAPDLAEDDVGTVKGIIFTEAIDMMKDGYIDCNTELAVFDIAKQSVEVAVMLADGKWDFQFPGRRTRQGNLPGAAA